jgi:hypothetical protein
VDVGVVRQLSAPRVQDAGAPRQGRSEATRSCGEPCEGERRGVQHRLGREALLRADAGSQRRRHGAGQQEVRPGQRCVAVVLKPRRCVLLLTLGPGAVATGRLDAVWLATPWALREAVAVVATAARLDGVDGLAVHGGEVGRALQVLGREGDAALTEGGHGRSPCLRGLRRS